MTAERAVRLIMGLCVLATLASLFLAIIITPIILVIGFSGQFSTVWNSMVAHPIRAAFGLASFIVLAMAWIWLMIITTHALLRDR
jgi:hypothetical protein